MALVINNISNLTQQQGSSQVRGAVLFCTSTYQHYLENLSYQPHAKLSGTQKCKGTFSTKQLITTIVACGTLRVNNGDAVHGYNWLAGYPWVLLSYATHGLHKGWHLPGGWQNSTLQLPAESGPCTPGSADHIYWLLGQFCRPDVKRSASVWGTQCSSGTGSTSGVSSTGQPSRTPFLGPCLLPLARVSFGLAPLLLMSMAPPLWPSAPAV